MWRRRRLKSSSEGRSEVLTVCSIVWGWGWLNGSLTCVVIIFTCLILSCEDVSRGATASGLMRKKCKTAANRQFRAFPRNVFSSDAFRLDSWLTPCVRVDAPQGISEWRAIRRYANSRDHVVDTRACPPIFARIYPRTRYFLSRISELRTSERGRPRFNIEARCARGCRTS